MTTPAELINLALKQVGVLGVGQTAGAEDIQDAFRILNMMISQWAVKRNVVHQILDVAPSNSSEAAYEADGVGDPAFLAGGGSSISGRQVYTVGLGGDFNIERPSKILGVYCRQLNPQPVDTPMVLLQSQTDWGRITTKFIESIPSVAYYDPQYPLGMLQVWPIPNDLYEIHIQCLAALPRFESISQDINLPPEYEEALMYNLAGRLYPMYGLPPDQVVIKLAAAALQTVRMANTQVGKLYMPTELAWRGTYNIYADR